VEWAIEQGHLEDFATVLHRLGQMSTGVVGGAASVVGVLELPFVLLLAWRFGRTRPTASTGCGGASSASTRETSRWASTVRRPSPQGPDHGGRPRGHRRRRRGPRGVVCVPGPRVVEGRGRALRLVPGCVGAGEAADTAVAAQETRPMCRSIKTLFFFEPPASDNEICVAALQFVRKISGRRSRRRRTRPPGTPRWQKSSRRQRSSSMAWSAPAH
jgi:hypothetical protein